MKNSRIQLGSLLFLALLISSIQSVVAQGTSFTYQGRLDDDGAPANGSYDFRFRLSEDSLGNVFVGAPVLANAVPVTSGLFTATLDFGAVFTGSNYWVQVDVKTNGAGGYTTLIPLQKITPTPYAIMANVSSNLLGTLPVGQLTGTIGTAQIADGTITSADLGPNSVNTTHIIDGQVANADLANDSVNSAKVVNASLVGADLANETITSLQLADTIALGDSNSVGRLDVFYANTLSNQPAITLFGSGAQISTFGSDGLEQTRLWGTSWGQLYLRNSLVNNAIAVDLAANSGLGGSLSLNNSNGVTRAYLSGNNSGGELRLYAADGGTGVFLDGESGGAGLAYLYNTNGSVRVALDGSGSGTGGQITLYAQDGSSTVQLLGESSAAGLINVNNSVSSTRVAIDGEGNGAGGQINVYSGDAGNGITLYGDSGGGGLQYLYTADGGIGVYLDGESGGAGAIGILNTNGSSRVILDGYNSYAAGQVTVYKSTGASGVILYGQDSAGDGRVVCDVLQINGGSDLSEQFDVKAVNETISPGAIVCIDPANPGKLVVSSKAYDRTVAGVLSGAGGVKPGMLMGQTGTLADGKHPVALTGRVYCLADADAGAIQPGDLITTSSTPGHGMKANDHPRAQGAIIGKAMTSLDSGKGLVLVLVSLQ